MHAKMKQALDVMGVIVNKEKRTAEVVNVDCIQIVEWRISSQPRVAQFVIAFGGCDSTGKFHSSPDQKELAAITIHDPVFSQYFMASDGNLKRGFSEELMDEVFRDAIIPIAVERCWTFDEIEISMADITVFKKEKQRLIEGGR